MLKAVAEENQANIAYQLWQLQSDKLIQEGYRAQYSWVSLNDTAKALVKSDSENRPGTNPNNVAAEVLIVRDFTKNIEIVYGNVTYPNGTTARVAIASIDENVRVRVRITLTKDANGIYHFDVSNIETIKTRTRKPFEGNGSSSG